jgi:hypothetical protein
VSPEAFPCQVQVGEEKLAKILEAAGREVGNELRVECPGCQVKTLYLFSKKIKN